MLKSLIQLYYESLVDLIGDYFRNEAELQDEYINRLDYLCEKLMQGEKLPASIK